MPDSDLKSDDYYKVLGVERSATTKEIAKAYKQLARVLHPDKNPDKKEEAAENFKIITEAYEVLSDDDKRRTYERDGKHGGRGGRMSFTEANSFFKQFFGHDDEDEEDPFSAMFFGGKSSEAVFGPGGFGSSMPANRFQQAPQAAQPPYVMPTGTMVVVHGLAKAQEHNGKLGRARRFDGVKGRYQVELEEDQHSLSLRPGNITQQCHVTVVGVESMPALNGQRGQITFYSEEAGRYNVKMDNTLPSGSNMIALEPGKVVLPKSTCVITTGLSKEELNGLLAQITEVDEEAMRYTVQLQNDKAIKITYNHVLC